MHARHYLPLLEYPITRQFESVVLSGIAYGLGLCTIVILCILNVALVGYDPVTVFQSDFNITQSFWYDKLLPSFARQQNGDSCDAGLFNTGDSLVTNASLFEWSVLSVPKSNAGETSGFSYKGEPMDNCDIMQIALYGDLRTWSVEADSYIYCGPPYEAQGVNSKKADWELSGVTRIGISALTARQTNFQRMAISAEQGSTTSTVGGLFSLAGIDIGTQAYGLYLASNMTGIVAFSVLANFDYCPPAYTHLDPRCISGFEQPPKVKLWAATAILANNSLFPSSALYITERRDSPVEVEAAPDTPDLDVALHAAISNFAQLARAAARIDLGHSAPNNFLTNLTLIDAVLAKDFPSPLQSVDPAVSEGIPSQMYNTWKSQIDPMTNLTYKPLVPRGPSTLQTVFRCRTSKLKSPGSLIVSVLVATLSMFSTAWGLSIVLATHFVKKRKGEEANCCQAHERLHKDSGGVDSDAESPTKLFKECGAPISLPRPDSDTKWEPLLRPDEQKSLD